MKKLFATALFAGVLLSGCDELGDEYVSERVIGITVASVEPATNEMTVLIGEGAIAPRYICKEGGGDWTLWYDAIDGFDTQYAEGWEYELRIYERVLANPPADAGDRVYALKEILEKTEKDSEGIPAFFLAP